MFYFYDSFTYNNGTLVSFHVLWYKLQISESKDIFICPFNTFKLLMKNYFMIFFPNFVNFDKCFALITLTNKIFLNIQYFPLHICVN